MKIVFENVGEIDLCPQPAGNPAVRGRQVLLETPGEIIARRLHRGAAMQPRDMFDIACVMKTHGMEYLD
ncbi:hypothetical protein [Sinorhizobium meliloti]|uniref:hypothetical protein n=1 Tax=Rhizobium meliloti TaxID=382 RepID=UPI000FDCC50E|nr:hypothetical protein [Sinorhizobium meliloti]RVQ51476.1 hypothetical protein CN245_26080 [Sinorhizobium meliloti]